MVTPVRVLILEGRPADAELMAAELERTGLAMALTRVETEAQFREHLPPTWT